MGDVLVMDFHAFMTLSFCFEVLAMGIVVGGGYLLRHYLLIKKPLKHRIFFYLSSRAGFSPVTFPQIMLSLLLAWLGLYTFLFFVGKPLLLGKLVYSFTAWVLLTALFNFVERSTLSRFTATMVWIIFTLAIFGWLSPIAKQLKSFSVEFGDFRLTALNVATGFISITLLFWATSQINTKVKKILTKNQSISETHQILLLKFIRFASYTLVALLGIQSMGVNLMALTVFTGAIGLGIGFGLQKVFSNLMSGVIILVDKSIKPGDVISVEGTYGVVKKLEARYVSVVTRDGRKHLIPNETFITQSVENWSYLDQEVRLRIPIGVAYEHDTRQVQDLVVQAALSASERVLKDRPPKCHLMELGDSALIFELRIWIRDPENGTRSATSAVLERVWETFKEHNITVPYPRRDIHIINYESSHAAKKTP